MVELAFKAGAYSVEPCSNPQTERAKIKRKLVITDDYAVPTDGRINQP